MDFSDLEILVVDDDIMFGKFYQRLIINEFKAKCYYANNPFEAFEYLKKNIPSLIILDMQMPEMDGYNFLVKLRSLEATKNIPVIACTSLSNKDLVIGLVELNIMDYIVKSDDPDLYRERIQNAMIKIKGMK